jgi:hypothetical protein
VPDAGPAGAGQRSKSKWKRRLLASRHFCTADGGEELCVNSQLAYDGFSHFVFSIGAEPHTVMPMFTLYCDDSGTHAGSDIAVAGCCIASVEQWREFKRNWDSINERENFGVFHMADFVAKRGQFANAEWRDQQKRDRTIHSLLGIIKTRAAFMICSAVVKSAYDEIVTSELRERMGKNHYTFAVRHCVALVDQWRARHGYTEPLQYVFDRMTKGSGDINETVFRPALVGGDAALQRYGIAKGGWSFQDKATVIQLQAADIWAWENLRYASRTFFAKDAREPVRQSYRFLRQRIPGDVRYHNRESLLRFVDGLQLSATQ